MAVGRRNPPRADVVAATMADPSDTDPADRRSGLCDPGPGRMIVIRDLTASARAVIARA